MVLFLSVILFFGQIQAASPNLNTAYAIDSFKPQNMNVATDASSLIVNIVNTVIMVAVILAFVYLLYGGLSMITSEGDAAKKATARQRMTWAAIGLLIFAGSWAIFNLITTVAFGGTDVELPVFTDEQANT